LQKEITAKERKERETGRKTFPSIVQDEVLQHGPKQRVTFSL
jgi:hypothetical protein